MTQTEKLEALVRKAIENGWTDDTGSFWRDGGLTSYVDDYNIYWLLLNHDFARALFREELVPYIVKRRAVGLSTTVAQCEHSKPADQFHLQQAVISKDPIGYMYKAVFGDE